MYQSSSLTFIYKYLFAPVWGGAILAGLILPSDNTGAYEGKGFEINVLVFGYVMVWLILLAVRLRRVQAGPSQLIIFSFHGNKRIDYKDIEYVSQIGLISPCLISLKYNDPQSGEVENILIMPSTTSEMFRCKIFKEHDMTQYIREQIVTHNPSYSREKEPSRWLPLGVMVGTLILMMIIVGFF